MAVPGRPVPAGAPADLAQRELFAVDAYLRDFEASVDEVDPDAGRVALSRTAFYPGGGGQPHRRGCAGTRPAKAHSLAALAARRSPVWTADGRRSPVDLLFQTVAGRRRAGRAVPLRSASIGDCRPWPVACSLSACRPLHRSSRSAPSHSPSSSP